MKQSQKAKYIICICILLVVLFSTVSVYRHLRPSRGLPYEKLTMDEFEAYMEFEKEYYLVDLSMPEVFARRHLPGAVNIPYDRLLEQLMLELPDKTRPVYICADEEEKCDKAARKLGELGYTGVAVIGLVSGWKGAFEGETE